MKARKFCSTAVGVMIAAAAVFSPVANATLYMSPYIRAISQVGFTAGVNLGHVVDARTNMNRLYAGGSFLATCASPYTGSIIDERFLPSEQLFGNELTVTIPAWLPAVRDMPGFDLVPGGTTLACTYAWRASAEESTYTISAGGIGITLGGGKINNSSSVPFQMYQPGGDVNPSHGCLP